MGEDDGIEAALRLAARYGREDLPAAVRGAAEAARAALGRAGGRPDLDAGVIVAAAVCDALSRRGGRAMGARRIASEALAARRRRLIRRDFDGRNHLTLARRHGVSVRTVRRLVDPRAAKN
ncbi:MAG: hypothetical protein F4Y34_08295 [Gammaproteobacteria bacterium]|nr:hypothetical protein [Gammaproteobacteria bacterium]